MAETFPAAVTLADGRTVDVRPISAADLQAEREFIMGLSPSTRRYRFLEQMKEPSQTLLDDLTDVDHVNDEALVAIAREGEDAGRFVGVARYAVGGDPLVGELALTVADAWRETDLQQALLDLLVARARQRGLASLVSLNSSDDRDMRVFARETGFRASPDPDDATQVLYRLAL